MLFFPLVPLVLFSDAKIRVFSHSAIFFLPNEKKVVLLQREILKLKSHVRKKINQYLDLDSCNSSNNPVVFIRFCPREE